MSARHRFSTLLGILTLTGLFLVFSSTMPGRAAGQAPQAYLPLIEKSPAGISGRVSVWGEPAANVLIGIGMNGGGYPGATTTTDMNGRYLFSPPSLVVGESYQVGFQNYSQHPDGRILLGNTEVIPTYIDPSNLSLLDFDLADIFPLEPVTDSVVTFPVTFRWQKPPRPAGGNYFLKFISLGITDGYPPVALGDVNHFTMNELPCCLHFNNPYWWSVYVQGPNGSFAMGFYHSTITFLESGRGLNTFLSPEQRPNGLSLPRSTARWSLP